MKRLLSTACLLLLAVAVWAQGTLNLALKKELDSLFVVDQKYRHLMGFKGDRADSLASALSVPREQLMGRLWAEQNLIDSLNLHRIEQILQQYGYPGKTLVGSPTNETAFFIVQHSPKINEYIPIIEAAARNGELPFHQYAMMYDRQMMQEGKEQLYGTQGLSFSRSGKNGQLEQSPRFIWPIKDALNVNSRRKEAGFPETVEVYARHLGVEYKALTLEEVKVMQKSFQVAKQ